MSRDACFLGERPMGGERAYLGRLSTDRNESQKTVGNQTYGRYKNNQNNNTRDSAAER